MLNNSSLKKSSERVETKKQNLLKKDEIYNIKQKEELQRQVNQYQEYNSNMAELTRKEQGILDKQLFELNELEK